VVLCISWLLTAIAGSSSSSRGALGNAHMHVQPCLRPTGYQRKQSIYETYVLNIGLA
jgi:hypothetical protein